MPADSDASPTFTDAFDLGVGDGNSQEKYLVILSVAVVGSATSRYGSALAARSNLIDPIRHRKE